MNRAYKYDKTIALAKAHDFHAAVSPKKIVNPIGYKTNNFINNEILLNDIPFV